MDAEAARPLKGGGGGGGGGAASSSWSAFVAAHKVPLILAYYGLCSSTLIVINKVAVHTLQAPVFILVLQLLSAALTVKALNIAGVLDAEKLQWSLVRPFLLIVLGFLGTLYANIKVLVYSNVETFITFRSATPLVLSLFDYLFLGRELPGRRSLCSILLLIASCAGYTAYDQGFHIKAYTWLCVWCGFFLFEACYVKHVCDTVAMSNWGRVYYTNFLAAAALLLVFPLCSGEHAVLAAAAWDPPQVIVLFMSCAVGVCMSHAGYLMRSNVSATAGVVVGVVCKLGSVLLNLLIWDQHASPIQLCFLGLGLAGGSLFQQAPLRARPAPSKLPLAVQELSSDDAEGEGLIPSYSGALLAGGARSESSDSSCSTLTPSPRRAAARIGVPGAAAYPDARPGHCRARSGAAQASSRPAAAAAAVAERAARAAAPAGTAATMQGVLAPLGQRAAAPARQRAGLSQRSGTGVGGCRRRAPLGLAAKFSNPFDGLFGGSKGGDSDAARRAIERSLGGAGKSKQQPPSQQPGKAKPGPLGGGAGDAAPKAPGGAGGFSGLGSLFKKGDAAAEAGGGGRAGFGGLGGAGGGGGGGGWNWGGAAGDDAGGGGEKPIQQELLELFRGMWVVFWNAALFLAFADVLHRSLDWCCQVELLLLVGAPAQAFERVASRFYAGVEWLEANLLGWKIPGPDDTMPLYRQIALYYPEEHAYTFDAYRYKMSEPDKQALKRFYALRWWERDGGFAGDVTAAEVQAIKDKYSPDEADLRAFRRAREEGTLDAYWAARAERLRELTGSAAPPPVAAREARADAAREPLLSSFLYASILAHDNFSSCLAFVLSARLACPTMAMLQSQLFDTFDSVLRARSELCEAALADIEACRQRDPACLSASVALLFYKGYHALQLGSAPRPAPGPTRPPPPRARQATRIAGALYADGRRVMALALQSRISEARRGAARGARPRSPRGRGPPPADSRAVRPPRAQALGVDIHPGARLGSGLFLDHGGGVDITLGGTGKESGDRHPKVGDNVLIGARAKVLGNITIGHGALIAPGSLVLKPLGPLVMVAGSPAQVVGERTPGEGWSSDDDAAPPPRARASR
ncbi:SAT2 [Scenedesmus sp. PABB004]|nr:SAT2 [Scenedesmus sp. PABB004]